VAKDDVCRAYRELAENVTIIFRLPKRRKHFHFLSLWMAYCEWRTFWRFVHSVYM